MTEKERNLLYGVVSLILPENILDQFDIVKLEDEDIARNDGTYQPFKHNVRNLGTVLNDPLLSRIILFYRKSHVSLRSK